MKDINNVFLVARITKDAELREFNGFSVANFSVAVNRSVKRNEQWQDEASFFDCSLGGRLAESLISYLVKGQQVAINGELVQDRWEKDGIRQSRVKIQVADIQLVGSKPQQQQPPVPPVYQQPPEYQQQSFPQDAGFPEDIPF